MKPHGAGIAGDGVFSLMMGDSIQLVDLKTNTTTNLVDRVNIKDVSDVRPTDMKLPGSDHLILGERTTTLVG